MRRLAAALIVMLTSCGTPPASDISAPTTAPAHWFEPCTIDDQWSFAHPLSSLITVGREVELDWIEVSNPAAAEAMSQAVVLPDDGSLQLKVIDPTIRTGLAAPETVVLAEKTAGPAREAIELGAHLLIGVTAMSPEEPTALVVALLETADQAVFLGPCAERWNEPLRDAAASFGSASVVEFARRVVDPDSPEAAFLVEATAPPTTVAWSERDPDLRLLSAEWDDAPEAVLARLTLVPVLIVVPPAWQDVPVTVCFKLSLGWHEGCMPTTAIPPTVIFYVSALPGEPVEVWLLNDPARLDQPVAYLATLEAATVADLAESLEAAGSAPNEGLAFELTLTGDPASIEDVQSMAASGSPPLQVQLISYQEAVGRVEGATPQAVPASGPLAGPTRSATAGFDCQGWRKENPASTTACVQATLTCS